MRIFFYFINPWRKNNLFKVFYIYNTRWKKYQD